MIPFAATCMDLEIAVLSELGKTLGDGEGQGGLACCSPCGRNELDMTGRMNSNNSNMLSEVSHTEEKYPMISLILGV